MHDALISARVSVSHIYEDQTSGRHDDRPGLTACLKVLRDIDTLLVWKPLRRRPPPELCCRRRCRG
ncbi:MAG: recombinase family protein [Comamonas sp.]|nr:recombinase family protein [Comamonas sp.]